MACEHALGSDIHTGFSSSHDNQIRNKDNTRLETINQSLYSCSSHYKNMHTNQLGLLANKSTDYRCIKKSISCNMGFSSFILAYCELKTTVSV